MQIKEWKQDIDFNPIVLTTLKSTDEKLATALFYAVSEWYGTNQFDIYRDSFNLFLVSTESIYNESVLNIFVDGFVNGFNQGRLSEATYWKSYANSIGDKTE